MNRALVETVYSILSVAKFDGITARFKIFQLKHFMLPGAQVNARLRFFSVFKSFTYVIVKIVTP